ncbi:MAG: glycosyltransferase [Bacteroidota bacterium]
MDLSVIIVNYNVKYFLEQCLKSVFLASKGLNVEIFVVDNNSVDGSQEMIRKKFPHVHLIDNKENLGFSRANNQALSISKGRYALLLNPDTVVEDDTFRKVVSFMDEHPDAGGLGVKMLDGSGKFLPESKRGLPTPSTAFYKIFGLSALFPKSRTFGKYHLGYLDKDKIHEVEVLSGAFLLMRAETIKKAGLLDEDFFMYGEDIDISYRIIKAGYKNYYFPKTRIIHYKGESTKKSSINYVFVFYNAMIIFARKHFSKKNAKLFSFFINLAIYFRASLAIFNRFVKRIFWPVFDFALIYAGYFFIKNYWEQHYMMAEYEYYPPYFMQIIVPVYILIWLFSVWLSGGYDKPVKLFRIVRGIGLGAIIVLVIYALLPISLRFSRALILLGALWALISMLSTRSIFHFYRFKNLGVGRDKNKRIIIAGKDEEAARVATLIRTHSNPAFVGTVSKEFNDEKSNDLLLGSFNKMKELVEVYKIDEIIFCGGEIPPQDIIDKMSELSDMRINFKIAPPESLYVIGSNSIDTFEDMFMVNINVINKPANERIKKLFDLIVSFGLIISFVIVMFFVKNPFGLLKNIFSVIVGNKTWVGYHPLPDNKKLPKIRKSVLNPADAFKGKSFDVKTLENLNSLYAREYKLEYDINIFFKGFRSLGRRE